MSKITEAYSRAVSENQQADAANLREQASLMQIYGAIQAQQERAQGTQRNDRLRAEIAALPPERRTRENVLPLLLKYAGNPKDVAGVLPASETKGQPIGSGGLRLADGTIVPPAARPESAKVPAPTTLNKLLEEKAKLPANDQRHKIYDAAIRKESETAAQITPPKIPAPPKGYQWTDDTHTAVEPIPGGPKDTHQKDAAKVRGAVQKADTVIGKVDEALGLVGPTTTGLLGDIRSTLVGRATGSGAYDLEKTLDTIKSNLGFSELQAMRDASPTGGALGQVAIQELAMLQATVASLEKGQDAEILRRNLNQVKKHFQNWKNAVVEASQGAAAPPATPLGPAVPPAPALPTAPSTGGWTVREKGK